ncbi:hypothetical protein [uncultured Pseudoteredinibacter sp.]|uniref:hypothetical protein n=1 Tax=uncultured Pseudoteredinibacter sp. TaxID=1641701 RepID=UPI0026302864|nr:hypothetical protein [uncultured Pseudoteredinibacter sp.]
MRTITLLSTALLLACSYSVANDAAKVWIEGDRAFYHAEISAENNKQLFDLAKTYPNKLKTLEIKSGGGDIHQGMDLGEYVFKNKLNVAVNSYCFSSCANYVFTAGNNKSLPYLKALGFHGGASIPGSEPDLSQVPQEFREQAQKQLKQYMEKANNREAAFYDDIGVQQRINSVGHLAQFEKQKQDFEFWYYSLEDLRSLGVRKVSLKPLGKRLPKDKQPKMLQIELSDITP